MRYFDVQDVIFGNILAEKGQRAPACEAATNPTSFDDELWSLKERPMASSYPQDFAVPGRHLDLPAFVAPGDELRSAREPAKGGERFHDGMHATTVAQEWRRWADRSEHVDKWLVRRRWRTAPTSLLNPSGRLGLLRPELRRPRPESSGLTTASRRAQAQA